MSNIVAGDVFQKIIEEVINASQNDFEENGVQQQTLSELQQSWQHKLSAIGIAQMPWDPKPAPPQQQAAPAPVPANPPSAPAQSQPSSNGQTASNGTPRIKNEPGTEPAFSNVPQASYPPQATNQMLAQQRAASLLQAQFGTQANASIGAMAQQRGGIALPGQQRPQGLQLPGQVPQTAQQQYAQQMRSQQATQQPRVKAEEGAQNGQYSQSPNMQQPSLSYAQTDGGADPLDAWNSLMAERRMLTAEDVKRNDRMMRSDVAALAQSLDSGLMMPLPERKRANRSQKRVVPASSAVVRPIGAASDIPQFDGEADIKDEEDEDAINSDLDSSEDEGAKEDEDDDDIDSMLCTYDKVQRVKNKWKCTLKDGILRANGKEYLFHKAQGEFEW